MKCWRSEKDDHGTLYAAAVTDMLARRVEVFGKEEVIFGLEYRNALRSPFSNYD